MKFLYKLYEKYTHSIWIHILIRIFVKSQKQKIQWLRICGMRIGEGSQLSCNVGAFPEPFMVTLGEGVYVSYGVQFLTHDGSLSWLKRRMGFSNHMIEKIGRISIGDNCFIGANAMVLQNVNIGRNCIIAAGAIVTKSFGDNQVIGGIPARTICTLDEYFERNAKYTNDTCSWKYGKKRKYYETNDL